MAIPKITATNSLSTPQVVRHPHNEGPIGRVLCSFTTWVCSLVEGDTGRYLWVAFWLVFPYLFFGGVQ